MTGKEGSREKGASIIFGGRLCGGWHGPFTEGGEDRAEEDDKLISKQAEYEVPVRCPQGVVHFKIL